MSMVEKVCFPPVPFSDNHKDDLRRFLESIGEYTEEEAKNIEDELKRGVVGMYPLEYLNCIVLRQWASIQKHPLKVLARLLRWKGIYRMLTPDNLDSLMAAEPRLVAHFVVIAMEDLKQGKLSDADLERIVDMSRNNPTFGRCVRNHLPSIKGASTEFMQKINSLSERLPESMLRDFKMDRQGGLLYY